MNKQVLELVYGACIKPDGNGFIVTFRDLSNVFSCGETRRLFLMQLYCSKKT
jgi:predicted RNase H-like HicB family nuclease